MLGIFIGLIILMCMLWVGFKLTGALLVALFWLFVEVPVALALMLLALVFCCTIILIPVGFMLFKTGFRLLVPGI